MLVSNTSYIYVVHLIYFIGIIFGGTYFSGYRNDRISRVCIEMLQKSSKLPKNDINLPAKINTNTVSHILTMLGIATTAWVIDFCHKTWRKFIANITISLRNIRGQSM